MSHHSERQFSLMRRHLVHFSKHILQIQYPRIEQDDHRSQLQEGSRTDESKREAPKLRLKSTNNNPTNFIITNKLIPKIMQI